ncbi:transcriptional regulator, partial [Pseudomonas sp. SIMBA_064]
LRVPFYELRNGLLAPVASKHLRLPAKALKGLGVHAHHAICLAMPASNMVPLIPLEAILAVDLGMTQVIEGETYALLHNG